MAETQLTDWQLQARNSQQQTPTIEEERLAMEAERKRRAEAQEQAARDQLAQSARDRLLREGQNQLLGSSVSSTAPVSTGAGSGAAGATATESALGIGNAGATSIGGGVSTIPAGQAVPAGFEAVGTAADGSTMIASSGSAGAGGIGGTGIGAAGSAGSYLGIANNAYRGYGVATNDTMTQEEKAARLSQEAGMAVANYFTGGLAELARTGIMATGEGRKWDKKLTDWQMKIEDSPAGWVINPYMKAVTPFLKDIPSHKRDQMDLAKLAQEGVYVPEQLFEERKRRSKEELLNKELAADFIGWDANKNWVNNKFSQSRDVADLRAPDVANYAAFAQYDHDWFKRPMEERLAIARDALSAGAITEGHGQIGIDKGKWTFPELAKLDENGQPLVDESTVTQTPDGLSQAALHEGVGGMPASPIGQLPDGLAQANLVDYKTDRPGDPASLGEGVMSNAPARVPQQSAPGGIDFTNPAFASLSAAPTVTPPRGTRLSPGIYADGKGGSYRA